MLRIAYFSPSGGKSSREIVPFAFADNGQRWHVRAFDRKSASFRDFVLTRILSVEAVDGDALRAGVFPEDDAQWARVVNLELVAHPDYAMRRVNVDCSPDQSLHGPEHTLWLRDPMSPLGVECAAIAPGYVSPRGEGSTRG